MVQTERSWTREATESTDDVAAAAAPWKWGAGDAASLPWLTKMPMVWPFRPSSPPGREAATALTEESSRRAQARWRKLRRTPAF